MDESKIAVALVSLGCPKNEVDAETMLGYLEAAGCRIVEDIEAAEVVIVNTCAFIQPAVEEAIEALLDIAALKEEGTIKGIVCSGCLTQRYGKQLLDELPEVNVFLNPGAIERVAEAVRLAAEGRRGIISAPLTYLQTADAPRWRAGSEWLAYLKIAEGCNNRCTFCTVPSLRGRYRSRPADDIRREFDKLAGEGVKEICLVAQDTTRYGTDLSPATDLAALLRLLDDSDFDGWVRLLYLHPDSITEELIQTIAQSSSVIPYFDIPLQHVVPRILKRMGRRGGAEQYAALLASIRRAVPRAALRTTFIVGFPGETEADFEALLAFVEEARFDRLSAFPYWPEEGTAAARLPQRVPGEVASERLEALMQLQEQVSLEINRSYVGARLQVLIERQERDYNVSIGRSFRDAPEIDGEVKVEGMHPVGQFVSAVVTQAEVHDLQAKIIRH